MTLIKLPSPAVAGSVADALGAACASELGAASERGLSCSQAALLREQLNTLQATVVAEITGGTTVDPDMRPLPVARVARPDSSALAGTRDELQRKIEAALSRLQAVRETVPAQVPPARPPPRPPPLPPAAAAAPPADRRLPPAANTRSARAARARWTPSARQRPKSR